jgi:hypothetical protein
MASMIPVPFAFSDGGIEPAFTLQANLSQKKR